MAQSKKHLMLEDETVELFREALRAGGGNPLKVSIATWDPSAVCAGCAVWDGKTLHSTQGPPRAVARWSVENNAQAAHLWVFEDPYTQSRAQMDDSEDKRKATPLTLVRLGRSSGYLHGFVAGHRVREPPLWRPGPNVWRAVVGLNRRKTPERSARDETAEACWHYARAVTKRQLVTPHGARCIDEAMAVCMVEAAMGMLVTVAHADRASSPRGQKKAARG